MHCRIRILRGFHNCRGHFGNYKEIGNGERGGKHGN